MTSSHLGELFKDVAIGFAYVVEFRGLSPPCCHGKPVIVCTSEYSVNRCEIMQGSCGSTSRFMTKTGGTELHHKAPRTSAEVLSLDRSLLWGAVLGIPGLYPLDGSRAAPPNYNNQQCLRILPNAPWWAQSLPDENC